MTPSLPLPLPPPSTHTHPTFRCILSLELLTLPCFRSPTDATFSLRHTHGTILLCTGATDGRAAFWLARCGAEQPSLSQQPVLSLSLHQSGVKCLSARLLPYTDIMDGDRNGGEAESKKARVLLASGGDDNALVVTLLEISETIDDSKCSWRVVELSRTVVTSAHASSLTGKYIINGIYLYVQEYWTFVHDGCGSRRVGTLQLSCRSPIGVHLQSAHRLYSSSADGRWGCWSIGMAVW